MKSPRIPIIGLAALLVVFIAVFGAPRPFAQETAESSTTPADAETVESDDAPEVPRAPGRSQQPAGISAPTTVPPLNPPSSLIQTAAAPEHATTEFEFQGAPITAILEWYARLAKRSIISAPNLAGVVNFRSQTKLTTNEAIQALDSVLAVNNIAAIPLGDKFLKIVPIPSAKQEGIPFGQVGPPADTLGTQIIPLKYAEAQEVIGALQPYLHGYGQLLALTKSNSILITETAGNLKQMLEIIAYVDQPSALRMEMRSYLLSHAKAADVMQRLQSMIQEAQQAGARPAAGQPAQPGQPVRRVAPQPGQAAAAATGGEETAVEGKVIMTADERTNKIFILTRPSNFNFFDQIIAELDAKVEPDVVMKVIELDYANAEEVASLMNSLITGAAPTTTRRTTGTGTTTTGARPPSVPPPPVSPVSSAAGSTLESSGFLQFAEGVRIIPDPRVNSILVMATKEDLSRIEALIKSVDTPVAQVLVEVVIAEVNLDNELDVGVEIFKRQFQEGQVAQLGASRTGQVNAPENLLNPTALSTNLGPLGLASGLTYFLSFQNLKLDAVIRMLATSSRFKVLSTPIIQTLHNQEAHIIVGESRPIVSQTVADVVSTASTAVRSTVEYKDIAIELTVTPRINPDGNVTMDIEQKINDLGGNVNVNGIDTPIITKREAKSSVMVKDQNTIVLGGLIRENKSMSEVKVPIIGDIPFLGTLFKGKQTAKERTELIVFIRPTVLRGSAQAMAEARRRSEMLKAGEELELETKFPPVATPAGKKPTKPATSTPARAPQKTEAETETKTAAASPLDRQSAKVKALKMQDSESLLP